MPVDPEDVARLTAKWDQVEAMASEVEANGTPCPNTRAILAVVKGMLEDADETAAREAP